MKKPREPDSYLDRGVTRRQLIAGASGLAVAGSASSATSVTMTLDLDDPEDNLKALLKL